MTETTDRQHMKEDQNIEWKRLWKDEYLKEICGFANAQGGRLYIGKDDKGLTVPLADSRKLLMDLPNKVEQVLCIPVDVNLYEDGNLEYIEVNVAPSSCPVSYYSEYYYRSGSTNRLLKGSALTQFLMERTGRRWDGYTVPGVSVESLDRESLDLFRKHAVNSGRMGEEDVNIGSRELLDKLGLISEGRLKRAAVMLFHRDQDRYFSGCRVRIAKFRDEIDIEYQDEVRGSLILIAERVIDLLYVKYLKASVKYEKDHRIETYPYPRAAVRELVFNALIHSNWAQNADIQIRVDPDSLSISNCCVLPIGWTLEMLSKRHKSSPYNPDIARVFFRAGLVESWGRGITKVLEDCAANGNPEPKYMLVGMDLTVVISAAHPDGIPSDSPKKIISLPKPRPLHLDILGIVKGNGKLSQTKVAATLNLSRVTVVRAFSAMQADGLLVREGSQTRGVWHLSPLGEQVWLHHQSRVDDV